MLLVIGAFAATAALLAALGLFGVLSSRSASGSPRWASAWPWARARATWRRLVLRGGGRVAAVGAAIGVAGALALARVLERLLFETSARDPLAIAGVVALVALVSLAAAWLPARRASRVDPSRCCAPNNSLRRA